MSKEYERDSEGAYLLPLPPTSRMTEVVRSFSFKLNVGNYESRDFFCSQKTQCPADEAEDYSEAVHQFCKAEVLKAVRAYHQERQEMIQRKGVA